MCGNRFSVPRPAKSNGAFFGVSNPFHGYKLDSTIFVARARCGAVTDNGELMLWCVEEWTLSEMTSREFFCHKKGGLSPLSTNLT